MYERVDLKEINNIVIRNNVLDQYTFYNFPLMTKTTAAHLKCLRKFESMHERYLSSDVKKNLFIKEQFETVTYLLYSYYSNSIDYTVMMSIDHNLTEKDISMICKRLLDDIRTEENCCFLLN